MLFIAQEEDINLNVPILVLYFYIPEMPFHNKIMQTLSTIEEEYKYINYLAINCDDFQTQCIRFSILSVPTLLILKNSKEINRLVGLVKKQDLDAAFADICIQ